MSNQEQNLPKESIIDTPQLENKTLSDKVKNRISKIRTTASESFRSGLEKMFVESDVQQIEDSASLPEAIDIIHTSLSKNSLNSNHDQWLGFDKVAAVRNDKLQQFFQASENLLEKIRETATCPLEPKDINLLKEAAKIKGLSMGQKSQLNIILETIKVGTNRLSSNQTKVILEMFPKL